MEKELFKVPTEKLDLAIAHNMILSSDCSDDLEHAITFLRKNDFKDYLRVKDIIEKFLRSEIFG